MGKAARLHSDLLARRGQAVQAADAARAPRRRLRSVPFVGGAAPATPEIPVAPASAGRPAPAAPQPASQGEQLRFTLRLDRRRYRQLKILAARTGRTSQDIVLTALDSYFAGAGRSCACLRGEDDGCGTDG